MISANMIVQVVVDWLITLVNRRRVVEPSLPAVLCGLYNSRADTNCSSSSCEIHERRGRPAEHLQPLPGLIPLRLSTLSRSAACAGVLGSRLVTRPKSKWRLLAIISCPFESLLRRGRLRLCQNRVIGCRGFGADRSCGTPGLAECLHSSAGYVQVSDPLSRTGRRHVE